MHWYSEDGLSAYTVTDAKGNERPTTLRDARKFNYWPSVTTVIQVKASPGLDMYRQGQLLDAVWGCPPKKRDNFDIWKRKVISSSKEHANNASARGTQIHDALEGALKGEGLALHMHSLCAPVLEFLNKNFPNAKWQPERSFCNLEYGYGGKVDLSCPYGIILDFKTKDTDDVGKMKPYDDHHMQTAAYAVGLGMPGADRYNLFISTQVPGLIKLTKSDNFGRDWAMFEHLLRYWQLSNNYYPGK